MSYCHICGVEHSRTCSLLMNGAFDSLIYWETLGNADHEAGSGHDQLGAGQIATLGDALLQRFYVDESLNYTLDYWLKSDVEAKVNAAILNEAEIVVLENEEVVQAGQWHQFQTDVGLPVGSYTVRFSFVDVAVLIDDVCLAHIPISRSQIAETVHGQLGELATAFNLCLYQNSYGDEGDYSLAIDVALRQVGALDGHSAPSVKCLHRCQVDVVIAQVEKEMLKLLHNRAALQPTQRTVGPVTEQFSLLKALEIRMGMLPGQTKSGGVVQTRLIHKGIN